MVTRSEIIASLEATIKTLETALSEREMELRSLLFAKEVYSIEDLDDAESYGLGAEIESQLETLKELINDIKFQLKYICAFKNV